MASKRFQNVYLKDAYSIAGPVEGKGKIKDYNLILEDYYFNEKTFEQAEIKMQTTAIDNLLLQNKLIHSDISLLVSGDLSNQISVSSYAASKYSIPFLGVYSACASFVEALILAAEYLDNKKRGNVICTTSSHNLHAEKQFRFPIEYGAPKPETTTFTATGAVSCLITKEVSNIKIDSYTIGKVIDMGCLDASHMGAVMTPAAAEVYVTHLKELNRTPEYYDLVLTGDLGCVGSKILQEYVPRAYGLKILNHIDAGCNLYLKSQEETFAGASGPVALPLYFFNKVMKERKNRKILLIGTGSLHNPFFVNQKLSIPAVAHAISLEVDL